MDLDRQNLKILKLFLISKKAESLSVSQFMDFFKLNKLPTNNQKNLCS